MNDLSFAKDNSLDKVHYIRHQISGVWGLYSGLTKRALYGKRLFFLGWGVESVGASRIFWRFAGPM